MATFVLIHGGGGSSWDWHLVAPRLGELGHVPITVDLPSEDESAGWPQYVDTVLEAVGNGSDLVVVGHSLGGFTAPLVCARVPATLLVLVAAMIPSPGETLADWWKNTGHEETGYDDVFYHDVGPELEAEARRRERNESSKALGEPWPLDGWPETPTRYLVCRDDRMFPAAWARRHARERLGIEPDEIDGGHYVSLSRPVELADRLTAYLEASGAYPSSRVPNTGSRSLGELIGGRSVRTGGRTIPSIMTFPSTFAVTPARRSSSRHERASRNRAGRACAR